MSQPKVESYEAVVVGGGIAGLTCAAYLSRSGLRTLVLEKQNKTGGLIGTFFHEGFAFDSGARAFENSGILFPMLKNLGIELSFLKSIVSIGIGEHWVRLTGKDSLNDYAAMLKESFPANHADIDRITAEIRKVMGYLEVLYGIDNPLFREDMKDINYLKSELLPWLIKYRRSAPKISRLNLPVDNYLRRLTDNQALIDMVIQHFFDETPTFFALSYFSLYLDYTYTKGGTGSLPSALNDYIIEHGGEIRTGCEVVSIDAAGHTLQLADGRSLNYKKLVWAADQSSLYRLIQGANSARFHSQRDLVANSHGANSILTLFIGLNKDMEYVAQSSGPHAFYTPETSGLSSLSAWSEAAANGEEALQDWLSAYFERTTYEISCPVLRDPALAPEGQSGLVVSTLLDYGLTRHYADNGNYEKLKQFCSDKIIDVLERIFPGISESVLFSICATPTTLERINGSKEGAITGWAFTNAKMPAEMRLKKISKSVQTPINDIYQCGQWTFSPSGVPTCILTGKLAADKVSKDSGI